MEFKFSHIKRIQKKKYKKNKYTYCRRPSRQRKYYKHYEINKKKTDNMNDTKLRDRLPGKVIIPCPICNTCLLSILLVMHPILLTELITERKLGRATPVCVLICYNHISTHLKKSDVAHSSCRNCLYFYSN